MHRLAPRVRWLVVVTAAAALATFGAVPATTGAAGAPAGIAVPRAMSSPPATDLCEGDPACVVVSDEVDMFEDPLPSPSPTTTPISLPSPTVAPPTLPVLGGGSAPHMNDPGDPPGRAAPCGRGGLVGRARRLPGGGLGAATGMFGVQSYIGLGLFVTARRASFVNGVALALEDDGGYAPGATFQTTPFVPVLMPVPGNAVITEGGIGGGPSFTATGGRVCRAPRNLMVNLNL